MADFLLHLQTSVGRIRVTPFAMSMGGKRFSKGAVISIVGTVATLQDPLKGNECIDI